jgi:Flp pilus assembly protein TadB
MSESGLLAVLAGAVLGGGLFLLVWSLLPGRRRPPPAARRPPRARPGHRTTRIAWAVGAGLVTLLLTRWPVAAVSVGLLVMYWNRIAGGGTDERRGIERLEALAVWTESLRDTIAGAVGLEQAIPATATAAAPVLRPSLNLLVDRLRIREPLPDALMRFAADVDDPSADVVCSALLLNARLRGPGLRDVLTALANSTREELDMRRRIEASRRSIRRSVRIVLIIVLGVMGLLAILNRTYVEPYGGFTGQLVLAVVVALFLAGLLWLRGLALSPRTGRFLVLTPSVPADRPDQPDQRLRPAEVR